MSVWVVTRVAENDDLAHIPTIVLATYRTFVSARTRMESETKKLIASDPDWSVVHSADAQFNDDLPDFYGEMDVRAIVRTLLVNGKNLLTIQVTHMILRE